MRWGLLAGLVVGVGLYNVVGGAVLPDWTYVPGNLAVAGLALLAARRAGVPPGDVGLPPGPGWRLGVAVAAVAAAAVLAAALFPPTRDYFADERFVDVGLLGAAYEVLVRIPLGTALYEEIVFRGLLLGLLLPRFGVLGAVLASSALFGLWHVLPTLEALDTNPVGEQVSGAAEAGAVAAAVLVTFVAGVGFSWLRLRGGSLAAPVIAHAAVNCSAYLAGFVVVRYALA